MGAAHISAVFATWQHLPAQPFRLLTYMALVVPDSHSDPRFYKGRKALAYGIGRGVGDDEELPKQTVQAVKRNIQILTRAGAITPVYGGWRGKNTEYRLNLLAPEKGSADRTPIPHGSDPERGTESDPERGTESDPKGGRKTVERGTENVPPRNEKRTMSEIEEEISPSPTQSPTAHEGNKPTDGEMTLTHFEAKEILDRAALAGVVVADLLRAAPATCTTSGQRRIWAAQQLATKEAS